MRRLLAIISAVAIVAAAPSFALGQTASKGKGTAPADKAAPAGKAMNTMGNVTAVAPDSMTIKDKTGEVKFMIDKDTTVVAKGASHKSLALKSEGKASTLTEYVKIGDSVSVTYKESGGNKLASTIRVTSPPKK